MTRPLKLTPAQLKRLERNLAPSSPSKSSDERLVSLLHRIWWRNYAAITGKAYSLHEIHNDARVKRMRDQFVKDFLPELRRRVK
jgi:hypothetical protein